MKVNINCDKMFNKISFQMYREINNNDITVKYRKRYVWWVSYFLDIIFIQLLHFVLNSLCSILYLYIYRFILLLQVLVFISNRINKWKYEILWTLLLELCGIVCNELAR